MLSNNVLITCPTQSVFMESKKIAETNAKQISVLLKSLIDSINDIA